MIPLKAWVITNNSGTRAWSSLQINKAIHEANQILRREAYYEFNDGTRRLGNNALIQFYLKSSVTTLNKPSLFDYDRENDEEKDDQNELQEEYTEWGAINVYFTNSISEEGGFARMPESDNAGKYEIFHLWMANRSGSTLAHELA